MQKRPIVTAWSVRLSVMIVGTAKMAEPIEMLFGIRTRVGLRNHVLGGVERLKWRLFRMVVPKIRYAPEQS